MGKARTIILGFRKVMCRPWNYSQKEAKVKLELQTPTPLPEESVWNKAEGPGACSLTLTPCQCCVCPWRDRQPWALDSSCLGRARWSLKPFLIPKLGDSQYTGEEPRLIYGNFSLLVVFCSFSAESANDKWNGPRANSLESCCGAV